MDGKLKSSLEWPKWCSVNGACVSDLAAAMSWAVVDFVLASANGIELASLVIWQQPCHGQIHAGIFSRGSSFKKAGSNQAKYFLLS